MLEKWETPRVTIQEFEPNEYVAACWGVACNFNDANNYEIKHGFWDNGNVSHAKDHCGNSSNQVIYDDNEDGTADRMVETGTNGLGNLSCKIYFSDNYTTERLVSSVKVNDYIYWTTSAGDRTWHHQGYVTATADGHPNRS